MPDTGATTTTTTVQDHPVTLIAHHTLQPANKASLAMLDSPVKLGPLDQLVAPIIPVAVVYVYEPPASATSSNELISVARLQQALALLLDYYPHFTGRLHINKSDGTPEIDRLGSGALLLEAACSARLDAFRSHKDGGRILVTNLPGSGNALLSPFELTIEGICRDPIFTVQHTRFACGSVALGVKLPHNLCDASGFLNLVRNLAEIYRGLREQDSSATSAAALARPPHIQSYLAQPRGLTPEDRQAVLDFKPSLFYLAPVPQAAETAPPPPPRIIGRVLRFPGKALDAIKAQATDPSVGWVPTFAALAAHLHHRIYRARLELGVSPSELHRDYLSPVNLRGALGLPSEYLGNALFTPTTDFSHDLLADGPLWKVAKAIHDVTRLSDTPQQMRQTLGWIAAQPDKSRIRTHFSGATGSFMASQWSKFGMYNGVDFEVDATGVAVRPVLVSPPFSPIWLMVDGLAYFLGTEEESAASPAIDVNLSLSEPVWAILDKDEQFLGVL